MKEKMKCLVSMGILCHFLWGCSEQEVTSNDANVADKEYVKAVAVNG